jgi:hypothetical protein
MSEHRFRRHLGPHSQKAPGPATAVLAPPGFVPVAALPQSVIAEVYRIAYAAALARVIARRRCSAPFSLN